MTISTITVPNQQRCAPFFLPTGALITATPRSGATTTVEYTLGSQSDVINNVATWVTWPSGATAITRSDRSNEPMYIRATSAGGASVLTINDSPGIVSALVRDWASQSNIGTVSVLGQQNIAVSKSDADANESAALYSLLIPAGTLGANSMLRIRVLWTVPNSAATKRLRGRFGGTVLWNYDLTTNLSLPYEFIIANRNSLSAQISPPNSSTCFGVISSVGNQTFSVDFSTDQTFTVTAQWPVAGAGANNITLEQIAVEHLFGA